ncbi:MAG: transglycosylase SLT domain-containing protein [Prolixibacteraceae bacterium]|nr:transglycosylase SLT domain-containing protein [Prolixibacteraceae bacterium]
MMKAGKNILIIILLAIFCFWSTCGQGKFEAGEDSPDTLFLDSHKWAADVPDNYFFKAPPLPDTLSFMGSPIPLHRFDVRECLERELIVNCYFHSQTIRLIKLAPRFFSIIDPILAKEGVPADLKYLAVAESSLNPKAASPAGAAGFWQFMKGTAGDYGLEVNTDVDERYHIEKSTYAACKYLKDSYKNYENWPLVAASYNAGRGAIDRHIARQKVNDYFDLMLAEETERYVYRILSLKLILEDPVKYGFLIGDDEKYPLWETQDAEVKSKIEDLADFALSKGINYKILKYYNPWLRSNVLPFKADKTYVIKLPLVQ